MVGSLLLKSTLIQLRKNGERLPIVVCVKAADNSATFTRKNQDQGLIFSNETQRGCLRPMLLFSGSLHTKRTLIHLRKNGERLPIVACIIVAETRLLLLGNFETKARNLGMRPKVCCRPLLLFWKSFVVNDSFLTLSVHLVLYLFVLTLHAYHSFSYLSQFQSTTWQPHF